MRSVSLASFAFVLLAGCSVVVDRRAEDDPAAADTPVDPPEDPSTKDPGCARAPITLTGKVDVADVRTGSNCGMLVSGSFLDTVDFGGIAATAVPEGRDAFLAHVGADGVARWVLRLGSPDAGMDRVFDAVPDGTGGAFFTALYRRDASIDHDYAYVVGAVDDTGVVRWTTELLGLAAIAAPGDGLVRTVVQETGTTVVVDLDARRGTIVRRETLVSGAGGVYALEEQGGRFVALVGFGEGTMLAGEKREGTAVGFATVIVEPDGTMHPGSMIPAPDLQIWHASLGASPGGAFAAVFGFSGPLDVRGETVVSPPLVDDQGLSTAVLTFDAAGALARTEAFLTTGSMRAIGVSIDGAGTARAMIGVSNDVIDVDGVHLDGTREEARVLVDVASTGVIGATATSAERIWGQVDGTAFVLTRDEGDGGLQRTTIAALR